MGRGRKFEKGMFTIDVYQISDHAHSFDFLTYSVRDYRHMHCHTYLSHLSYTVMKIRLASELNMSRVFGKRYI